MAGLDDYQYFTRLQDEDNPFWERANTDDTDGLLKTSPSAQMLFQRPNDFPQKLQSSQRLHQGYPPENSTERYAEFSMGLGLLAEHLLSHPFIVLRRVCQVDVSSRRHHLFPITVAYAAFRSQQGVAVFWKGLGSVLIVKSLTMGVEDMLSKFTPLPKEVHPSSSWRSLGQHLLLKCSALAIVTPFMAASLVETVQSSVASDGPGVLDVFKEGLMRLLSFTQPQTGRLLPIWLVVMPTVVHGLLQYMVGNAVAGLAKHAINLRRAKQQEACKSMGAVKKYPSNHADPYNETSVRLHASLMGHLAADIILFPIETVVHRLQLQGTRTIIDSLDAGYEVKPILTRYEGFWDCLTTTLQEEGPTGLLKGFGALCLQYAAYGALFKFAHVIVREVSAMISNSEAAQAPTETVATPLAPTSPYTAPLQQQTSPNSSPRHIPPPGYSPTSPPLHSSPARQRPYPNY